MKVGDRVELINKYNTGEDCGRTGVILQIDGDAYGYSCAYIRMDHNKRLNHFCTDHLKVIETKDAKVNESQTDLFQSYCQGAA